MPQGVWIYLGLLGLIQLIRRDAATLGVMVLALALGIVVLWLAVKAWASVR